MPTVEFLGKAIADALGHDSQFNVRQALLQVRSMVEWAHGLEAISQSEHVELMQEINWGLSKI